MCKQTKNSSAKDFGNQSKNKNLKPKKSMGVTGLTPLCLFGLRKGIKLKDCNKKKRTEGYVCNHSQLKRFDITKVNC